MNMLMVAILYDLVLSHSSASFSDWQKVDAASHVSYRPICSLPEFWVCEWLKMWMKNETTSKQDETPILPEIHL